MATRSPRSEIGEQQNMGSDLLSRLEPDFAWFFSHSRNLRRKYAGEYVVIRNRRVAVHAKTMTDLKRKAKVAGIPLDHVVLEYVHPAGETFAF
ncbi:MAG: DUF5678 domain-containing protein [Thermoplasmatota archaeon]